MEKLWQDVRHTLRWMGRQKGFTAAASLTLALGIGANTAIFSVIYGVLLKPLPYADPERLVSISEEHPGANSPLVWALLSDVTLESWTPAMRTLEGVAAYNDEVFTVGRENPVRLPGASASPSLFPLLRVAPAAGRFFEPGEAVEGADDVVVLGHSFWRERFGGSPAAVGQSIFLDGRPRRIVGVAPPGFAFPSPEVVLWMPHVIPRPENPEQRGMHVFPALGRLKPGMTPSQAAAEGTAAARAVPRPMAADMLFGKGQPVEVRIRPMVDELTASIRPALVVLAVAVGLVLLIACANVSNLYLSRGVARQRELAVRSALGAGRGRLARQLLTESLVLSMFGGALGILLAWGLTRAVPALAPEDLPRLEEIQLDGRVLAFAVAASLLAGLLSGLVPTWRGTRSGLAPVLHEGDNRATSAAGKRLRGGLLVSEAALAVLLLIGAGLLIRSFARLIQVDGGYEPSNVLTAQLFLPAVEGEEVRSTALVNTLMARLQALPGVVAAGAANMAPFGNSTAISGFTLPAGGPDGEQTVARANTWMVTPGFGQALGLRVKSGRFLQAGDLTSGTQAMVVNEEFVRLFLADGKPAVGRRYTGILARGDDETMTEIVGVVDNVLKDGPSRPPQPEIYLAAGSYGREARRPGVPSGAHQGRSAPSRAGPAAAGARHRAAGRPRRGRQSDEPAVRRGGAAAFCGSRARRLRRARADPGGDRPLRRALLRRLAAAARDGRAGRARRDQGAALAPGPARRAGAHRGGPRARDRRGAGRDAVDGKPALRRRAARRGGFLCRTAGDARRRDLRLSGAGAPCGRG